MNALKLNGAMRRLIYNSAPLIASNLAIALFGIVTPLLIGRGLGAARFGAWAFSMTWASLLMMICTLGSDQLLTREASKLRSQSNQLLINGLCTKFAIFTTLGGVVFLAAPWLAISPESVPVLRIAVLIAGAGVLCSSFVALFRASEWTAPILWLDTGAVFAQLLSVTVILQMGHSLLALAAVVLAVQIARASAAFLLWRWRIKPAGGRMRPSMMMVTRTIRQSTPLAMVGLVSAAQIQSMPLLLGYLRGGVETGWFSAAMRVSETVRLIPGGALSAVYPMFAADHTKDPQFLRTFGRTMIALAVVLAVGVIGFARPVIELILGPSYLSAVPTLILLGVDLIPTLVSFSAMNYLLAVGDEAYAIKIQAMGVGIQVVASVPLIIAFGATGAAIAIVLGRLATCLPFWRRANAINTERSTLQRSETD